MKKLIEKVRNGLDLTDGDVRFVLPLLLSEAVPDETKAEFLLALHEKGETAEEVASFVELLMERAHDPQIDPAWGEPGLTAAEKVYAWCTFEVLAMSAGSYAAVPRPVPQFARAAAVAAPVPTDVQPSDLSVSAAVTVTYEIAP